MDKKLKRDKQANVITPLKVQSALTDKTYINMTPLKVGTPRSRPKSTPDLLRQDHSSSDVKETKISVSIRVRPPPTGLKVEERDLCLSKISNSEILVKSQTDSQLVFSYDNIFWYSNNDVGSDQQSLFETLALPLLDASLKGYNSCLFTYGQTGSGKTYSIMDANGNFTKNGMGIIPRFCHELIQRLNRETSKTNIKISYYEIYNEKIYDLLHEDVENRISLKVREHPVNGPYVSDLTVLPVVSFDEVLALIISGNKRRITGTTLTNDKSSRSHTIFDISLMKSTGVQSKVRLVDLAGSERVSQCAITNERFKEGLSINKSLLTLGKVITALAEKKKRQYIPYRESLLTWLLKDCLGGNSHTCMLATVSPLLSALEETLATLRWARKTQSIVCIVTKNEDPQVQLILELQNEIKRLKEITNKLPDNGNSTPNFNIDKKKLKAIENQQKMSENKLHIELEKLEKRLETAEREKTELLSQRNAILHEICDESFSAYESNFLENVKNLLECSLNSSANESLVTETFPMSELKNRYLNKMRHLSLCLKSIYEKELAKSNNHVNTSSNNAYQLITEIEERVQLILENEI